MGKGWIEAGLNGAGEAFERRLRVGKNARADGGIQAELGKIAPLCPSRNVFQKEFEECGGPGGKVDYKSIASPA